MIWIFQEWNRSPNSGQPVDFRNLEAIGVLWSWCDFWALLIYWFFLICYPTFLIGELLTHAVIRWFRVRICKSIQMLRLVLWWNFYGYYPLDTIWTEMFWTFFRVLVNEASMIPKIWTSWERILEAVQIVVIYHRWGRASNGCQTEIASNIKKFSLKIIANDAYKSKLISSLI